MSTDGRIEAMLRSVKTPEQKRNRRRAEDHAFLKAGKSFRLKAAAYFIRRGYLTKKQRRAASFIEGRWTPKQHDRQDEIKRRELRPVLALTMEVPRFHSNRQEHRHKGILTRFLTSLFQHQAAA